MRAGLDFDSHFLKEHFILLLCVNSDGQPNTTKLLAHFSHSARGIEEEEMTDKKGENLCIKTKNNGNINDFLISEW